MIHFGTRKVVLPVIKLEMIRGRMSIFSILMSISPGKAINITTSGWIGDAKRRSPPHTAPRMTPIKKRGTNLDLFFALALGTCFRDLSHTSLLSDDELHVTKIPLDK